jgi:hypothetical protein
MDGLKLYLQLVGSADIQERYYNGWTHDHYMTLSFAFGQMVKFQLPFSTSLDLYTTVRWLSLEKITISRREYICQELGPSAA